MEKTYFGTDGIRGQANVWPMDPSTALRVGFAAGVYARRGGHRHRVVVGKDTRLSGYMIEQALTAGLLSAGMDVFLLGPLPTPAVSMLTRSLRADLGVMISASHNLYQDNGIKLFDHEGYKLSDEAEEEMTNILNNKVSPPSIPGENLGRAKRIEDAQARYIEFAKRTFPKELSLSGLRIVVDCAHGASYKVAPTALWELGAEVIPIGVEPNGININNKCGSTFPSLLQEKVREVRADVGVALDGDADRLIMVDQTGNVISGDHIVASIAHFWQKNNLLRGKHVVATVMSNLAFEHYLEGLGIGLVRTKVGDRYVVEAMRLHGANLGGESSGHIVMSDFSTTGDGLVAALQVLAVMQTAQKTISEVTQLFDPFPQVLKNIKTTRYDLLEETSFKELLNKISDRIGKSGRILVRGSGTEPLIRIMVEGEDYEKTEEISSEIYTYLQKRLVNT